MIDVLGVVDEVVNEIRITNVAFDKFIASLTPVREAMTVIDGVFFDTKIVVGFEVI